MSQRVNHQKLRLWVGSFIEFQSHVGSFLSVHHLHAPITSARRMLVPGSLVTSLTLHSHPRSRGERSGSERSEKERNEPREMGCEGSMSVARWKGKGKLIPVLGSLTSTSLPFRPLHLRFRFRHSREVKVENRAWEGNEEGDGTERSEWRDERRMECLLVSFPSSSRCAANGRGEVTSDGWNELRPTRQVKREQHEDSLRSCCWPSHVVHRPRARHVSTLLHHVVDPVRSAKPRVT